MKNQIIIIVMNLFVSAINAQQVSPNSSTEKGIAPVKIVSTQSSATSKTYAVVVGISDYQDPGIPDLRFADKDAEAFAAFLSSKAGGSLDQDHLKLLLNKQATMAQFANALDWLMENAKEGDQAIIYFSGHGDVEKKTITQPGFLLCWDAPARVYMAGGAFNLRDVQEVVSTLSIQTKAKVIVITDACRSGNLAGNSVGGSQATSSNLAKQYANEIKILSCQPNEYSIEGEQWGGGRGAFSYNLVNALYGFADNNKDLSITLQEAGRYLEDHVTAEVAPVSQVPMIIGNRMEKIATVDATTLASIKLGNSNQIALLSNIDTRGFEDDVLTKADSSIKKLYQLFNRSLNNKIFLEPANACANDYYEKLINEPKLIQLHSTMKRNYAAALQDEAQQVLNNWLKSDVRELYLSKKLKKEKYQAYPLYLEKAAELLGANHYMYSVIQARKHLFKGYLISLTDQNFNLNVGNAALVEFHKALELQAELPHAYWLMSRVFAFNLNQQDSSEYYFSKANNLLPNWILPYETMIYIYYFKFNNSDRVKYYLEKASHLDTNSTLIHEMWGVYYKNIQKFDMAENECLKALEIDSANIYATVVLSGIYNQSNRLKLAEFYALKAIRMDSTYVGAWKSLGDTYSIWKKYPEAEIQFKYALQLDSLELSARIGLGILYVNLNRQEEAEKEFEKILIIDSTYELAMDRLASIYVRTERVEDGINLYQKLIKRNPNDKIFHYNLACVYSRSKDSIKGFEYLEKALKIGMYDYADWLQKDPDLSFLKSQTEIWNALMQKYFPDKFK